MDDNTIEILEFEKDLSEIESLLQIARRNNVIRNLENQKKTIQSLIINERKILEEKKAAEQKKLISNTNTNSTNESTETKNTEKTKQSEDIYKYTSVTNYGFENSDKFAK
jgi:hypothetical protein